MYVKDSVPSLPNNYQELMTAIVNIVASCSTGSEAAELIGHYLLAIQPHFTLSPSMAGIRAKAYAAAEQRRANTPFELRWRQGAGEVVRGWVNLAKRLKELEIRYSISTLRSMLSGGRKITRSMVNPESGMVDILEVARPPKAPKPKRGRPQGSIGHAHRLTEAEKVQITANPTGNKMRGLI